MPRRPLATLMQMLPLCPMNAHPLVVLSLPQGRRRHRQGAAYEVVEAVAVGSDDRGLPVAGVPVPG